MKFTELIRSIENKLNRHISQAEIARILDLERSSINMKIKREVEVSDKEFNLIADYYDIDINTLQINYTAEIITLERIGINPSCGKGTAGIDDVNITPVQLGRKLIENIFKVSSVEDLKVFRASGDSMEPTICDNDDLLVDTGRRDFNNGGIFVISINDDWFIKRLRLKINGDLEIISDNKEKYPTETKHPNDDVEIIVRGRVIKNLSRGL